MGKGPLGKALTKWTQAKLGVCKHIFSGHALSASVIVEAISVARYRIKVLQLKKKLLAYEMENLWAGVQVWRDPGCPWMQ